jgi:hypothetical protein
MKQEISTQLSEKLISFGAFTLAILERDKEWSADTISEIGQAAQILGLSDLDENGAFRIKNVDTE